MTHENSFEYQLQKILENANYSGIDFSFSMKRGQYYIKNFRYVHTSAIFRAWPMYEIVDSLVSLSVMRGTPLFFEARASSEVDALLIGEPDARLYHETPKTRYYVTSTTRYYSSC